MPINHHFYLYLEGRRFQNVRKSWTFTIDCRESEFITPNLKAHARAPNPIAFLVILRFFARASFLKKLSSKLKINILF